MRIESRTFRGAASNFDAAKSGSRKKPRSLFEAVASYRFPRKTAEHIAALTGESKRSIYGWMAGRSRPPLDVFLRVASE